VRVRFRADHDLDRDIVRGLLRIQSEIDFEAESLKALDDESVLRLTAGEGRVLVSHDVSTIPPLFFRLRGTRELPGVILIPQSFPIGQTIERLHMVWTVTESAEWPNRICYLPTLADFA
jgi:hypothetical protein